MENATKALLIAASVLIVIVLISVGIKLLSSTSGVTDQVDSASTTMATSVFNSQFLCYVSENTSANQVKALISKVIAHNSSDAKHQIYLNLYHYEGSTRTIDIGHANNTGDLQDLYTQIVDSSSYKIRPTEGCGSSDNGYLDGYINCISIFKQ